MQHTLHQLESPDRLAKLFTIVDIFYCMVKSCLHEPGASRQWVADDQDTVSSYPSGPPLRTSLSRSKPDIRTDAPLLTPPRTFSAQDAFGTRR